MGDPADSAPTGAEAVDLCVIGNVLIDVIMKGIRDLPQWGFEVLATGRSEDVGGQGANVARAAVRFGLLTAIVSVVADDAAGRRIRDTLRSAGVDTAGIETVPGDTPLAIAAVRPDGERAFLTDLGCSAAFDRETLARHGQTLSRARAVVCAGTTNLPGLDARAVAAVLGDARARGALSVFDPGWSDSAADTLPSEVDRILGVTGLFLPNRDEAAAMTGESEFPAILRALRERCPGAVIVTCGAEGSATLDGDTLVVAGALPVTVDSAVGAGDVFAAGAISGMLETGDPVEAMVRGTAAASRFISRSADRYAPIDSWQAVASQVAVSRH